MRLKSHESPRKGGRNDKGRGGAARQRQLKKRSRLLVKKLKQAKQTENPQGLPAWGLFIAPYCSITNRRDLRSLLRGECDRLDGQFLDPVLCCNPTPLDRDGQTEDLDGL